MAFFDFIENFFFISLGITFVLILLLVYHFKQRISSMERKGDTMYELITNIVKEMRFMKSPYCNSLFCSPPSSEEPSNGVAAATPSSPEISGAGRVNENEPTKPSVCPFTHEGKSSSANIQIVLSGFATPAVKHEGKIVVSEDESEDDSSADYASSESDLELDSESDSDDETEFVSKPFTCEDSSSPVNATSGECSEFLTSSLRGSYANKQEKQPEEEPTKHPEIVPFTCEDESSPVNTRSTTRLLTSSLRGSCPEDVNEAAEADEYVLENVNEDNYVLHKDAGAKNERSGLSYSLDATIGACSGLNTFSMNDNMDGQIDESDFLSGLNISPDELMGVVKQHGLESSANELFGDLHKNAEAMNERMCSDYSRNEPIGACSELNNFASNFDASMFYPKININPETDDTMGLEDITLDIETIGSDALFTYEDTSSAANERSGPSYSLDATAGAYSELRKDDGVKNERSGPSYSLDATTGAYSELRKDGGAKNERSGPSYSLDAITGAYSELQESSPEIINVVDTTTDTEVHATNVHAPAAPEPEPEKKNTREVYRKMNITQLRAIATAAGIQADTGKLKKNDLIQLLENLEE